MIRLFFVFTFLIAPFLGFSQNDSFGNWLMYFGQNKLSERFSLHTEVQFRNHTFVPTEIEQLLLRTGLNFHFNDDFFTGGYAYIPSYDLEDDINSSQSEEHRIWQQLIINHKIKKVKFEHRIRQEQRWVNKDFKQRFRYRLLWNIPLKKKFSLVFYEEIFLNFNKQVFDRNRAYGAIGYKISNSKSLQIGLLHQETSKIGKFYFQLAVFINPDLRKIQLFKSE